MLRCCPSLSHRAFGGIALDTFKALNPLVLCDSIGVQPGSAVCTGDNIAFCNDIYVAAPGDTCENISDSIGTVINVDGEDAPIDIIETAVAAAREMRTKRICLAHLAVQIL